MATNHKYPFITGEELKRVVSQIDISFDNENITGSFRLAKDEIIDIVSKAVWDRMMAHYNSGDYTEGGATFDDKLVDAIKPAFGNFGIYHHFIWLQLRISNNAVTVTKSENETAAYKYQTDEAKDKLLQTAWVEINTLIDLLGDEAPTEWLDSEQFEEMQNLIIKNYKAFDKIYKIDKNAAFFIKTRHIQQRIIDDEVTPRIGDYDDVSDPKLDKAIKRALAYKVMSDSCIEFDYYFLPAPIRRTIDNEMVKKKSNDALFAKEKLSGYLLQAANRYFQEVDYFIADENKEEGENPYENFEDNYNKDLPFASII
jgi:hypothetical protein